MPHVVPQEDSAYPGELNGCLTDGGEQVANLVGHGRHQLRHNAATFLRKEFGLEAARVILGHRSAAITEVYAELDHQKAVEAMLKIG